MANNFIGFLAVLAMAFAVSCTSDIESAEEILAKLSSSSEGNSQSYGYCILSESKTCLEGPYTLNDCNSMGGRPSNSCPYSSINQSSSSLSSGTVSSSSSAIPSSSSVAPSSSSIVQSSSSVVPSSSSIEPSSSSVTPSSSSVIPSSSSVAPSSGSSSLCAYELTEPSGNGGHQIDIPNEPVVICMNLPSDWKTAGYANFACNASGLGLVSGVIGTGESAVEISGNYIGNVQIPYDWTINGYKLPVDLQCQDSCKCEVYW